MRLIDADVAERWMKRNKAFMDVEVLRAIPTIDAVPVVRCKDCKYYNDCTNFLFDDDFCSRGEYKTNTVKEG